MILVNIRYCSVILLILLFVTGCTGGDKPKLLKYGDGVMDNKVSLIDTGHAISFKKPYGNWAIKGVRFFAVRQGSGTGNDKRIVMTICDANLQPIVEQSVLHNLVDKNSEKWRAINVNPYILCPDEFLVILDCNNAKDSTIFIGIDSTVKATHSKKGEVGGPLAELEGTFDWMIRVELRKLNKEELDRLVGDEPEV